MSASEMLTLVRHLSLIIGHLVPEDDEVWQLFLSLHDIIIICTSFYLDSNAHFILRETITDYLEQLNNLFFIKNPMKPKHHFLLHYPDVLLLCGPLSRISTMRFEAEHREGKRTSSVSINRVNLCKTIAIKHQLRLNYKFLLNEFPKIIVYEKKLVKNDSVSHINSCLDIQRSVLPFVDKLTGLVSLVKSLSWEGKCIDEKTVIMTPSEDGPLFFDVNRIIVSGNQDFILIVKQLQDVIYDIHTQSYKIESSVYSWKVLTQGDLFSSNMTYAVRVSGGFRFIIKNWW